MLAQQLPGGDSLPRQIANAHVAFNVLGVVAFLPFTSHIARLLERAARYGLEVHAWLNVLLSASFSQPLPAGRTTS